MLCYPPQNETFKYSQIKQLLEQRIKTVDKFSWDVKFCSEALFVILQKSQPIYRRLLLEDFAGIPAGIKNWIHEIKSAVSSVRIYEIHGKLLTYLLHESTIERNDNFERSISQRGWFLLITQSDLLFRSNSSTKQ